MHPDFPISNRKYGLLDPLPFLLIRLLPEFSLAEFGNNRIWEKLENVSSSTFSTIRLSFSLLPCWVRERPLTRKLKVTEGTGNRNCSTDQFVLCWHGQMLTVHLDHGFDKDGGFGNSSDVPFSAFIFARAYATNFDTLYPRANCFWNTFVF